MTQKPLILIDGSSWLFRAFYALPPLANARGEPTGMVYGFGNMLRKLCKDFAPERIAVVFDPPGPTQRNQVYAEYKANREETPEALTSQFPHVMTLIEAMGFPLITVANEEADDVIGTLTVAARQRGIPVLIVTSDKDMAQLVDGDVKLLDTMKGRTLDAAGVTEKFGVPPERIVEYLALVGDTSDNIPGVPLVGPKRAADLLNQYGSLDQVIANAAGVKGKVGENLRASLGIIPLAKQLATIRCDLELPLGIDDLVPKPSDDARLRELYRRMGFNRWLEELGAEPAAAPDAPGTVAPPAAADAAPASASPRTRAEAVTEWNALEAMLQRLSQATLISVDTETDSLCSMEANLVGLSFAIEPGHGWYVPLAHNYLGAPPQLPMAEVLARVKPLLEDPRKAKVGQHIKYDLNVLHRHGIEVQGVAFDTMLESYVLDAANQRHDMDSMALTHLNHQTIRYSEVAGKGKGIIPFNQVPVDGAAEYAAEDADITLRLHHALHPKVSAVAPLKKVFDTIEMPLVPVLARIEQNGVKVDVPLLKRISTELAHRMEALQRECWECAGGEFNLGSPPQLTEILYDRLKLPVLAKTPKGQPSTGEDALEQLASQHPLPRLILDWRALSKLRSTYSDQLPLAVNRHTGRIHTSYHQAVAATGRLASQDPNLQNIPIRTEEGRRIRQAFVPEPGNALVSIDYSQIELRLMAHLSHDPLLTQAFRSGMDVHQATAAEVFGFPPDQVPADKRRAAKAINFGLMYGLSAFGLAKQLGIARGEAQGYMETFFQRYAGVKAFMDGTRELARRQGWVETLFGRRLYLKDINSRNAAVRQYAERTAINAPLQGSAADLIKLAMIDAQAFLDREHPDIRMILQVHDELVFEGPAPRMKELGGLLADRMCRITRLDVPLVADWGFGENWDESHAAEGHASSN
ncbi:MAG TPA: DNA polymerase I [Candidatus Binatia bacterium]|nr:DNA polymerase I [Candidatus Binatia bacterium]